MKLKDYNTPEKPTWCPGCGNFGTWAAFKNAAAKQGWDSSNSAIVSDVGCHGHIANYTNISSVVGLHGRSVPVVTGIKLANNTLNTFVFIGDGGCLGEGGNHFIHTCRRNHDFTMVIHDNAIYGLTTGQTSPLSPHGFVSKSTPDGNLDIPLNPVALAISSGATFVARELSSNIEELTELFIKANNHKGIAILDILQPCPSFNKECTPEYFQQNSYRLLNDWDPTDKVKAFEKSQEWGDKKIGLGIFYLNPDQPSYEAQIPQTRERPIVAIPPQVRDISDLFKKLM
jgi:2-oxoglutarate/2-oxoacid ferredoxin oxidoreductase subunit beta